MSDTTATTRVYAYGAKPPHAGAERVADQIWLAHRYRNKLTEIERERRENRAGAMSRLAPGLAAAEAEAARLTAEIEAHLAAVRARNAEARRKTGTPEDRARTAELRAARKDAWAAVKRERAAAKESPEVKAATGAVDAEANARVKAERAACGVYWGTYLLAEAAMDRARQSPTPPQFRRWDGSGAVAVQIQGGLSVADLLAGSDTRLRLVARPGSDGWSDLFLRVGSGGKGGPRSREPVWAVARVRLHRPLPESATVKWCSLFRERVAGSDHWRVLFTLTGEFAPKPRAPEGAPTVAIDLGWRVREDGSLRVAYWADDAGGEGEWTIPAADAARWRKSDDLQSTRDLIFDGVRSVLGAWLAGERPPAWLGERVRWLERNVANDLRRGKPEKAVALARAELAGWSNLAAAWPRVKPTVPEWLSEATARLASWRSAGRLAGVVLRWRDNAKGDAPRFEGDAAILAALEAWRRRDRHLWEWAVHGRRKAIAWRLDYYRNLTAGVRRKYARVVVEDADWRKVQRPAAADAKESDNQTARYNMRVASVGKLKALLVEAGAEEVSSVDTTRRHHACGEFSGEADPAALHHTCRHCLITFDNDANAAHNLLSLASGGMVTQPA